MPAWRRLTRGLKFRLVVSYLIFFAVILAAIGFLFRQTLSNTMSSHSRAILEEEWAAVKGYLRVEHGQPIWFYDKDDPDEAFFVERLKRVYLLTDLEGRVLEASNGYLSLGVESPQEIRNILTSHEPYWAVRRNSRGTPFLIRAGALIDEKRPQYFMAIGRALSDEEGITGEFTVKYLALVPVLLLAAALMGWLFAGPALQPLNSLAAGAQRISASNLKVRIERRGADDELDHLIETFNSMMDRLNASFQQSRQFSADVSHELRTPLTAIRGQLEVALFTAQTVDQHRDAMVNALQDVERLSHLVKTLLLLSQAEAGHLVLRKAQFDLSEIVKDMVDQFQIPAEEACVRLTADLASGCQVDIDRLQIERMITNLLSNAIKYTPPAGEVRASVQRKGGWVELAVEDTGIGIPADHLPYVFDRFFRVPTAAKRDEQGLGLGLSFVAWIVKAHGGSIEAKSVVGKGSRFTVRLPLVPGATVPNEEMRQARTT